MTTIMVLSFVSYFSYIRHISGIFSIMHKPKQDMISVAVMIVGFKCSYIACG